MKDVITKHIEMIPGICSGKPKIAGHRITVQNIVIWHERIGRSADEIATEFNLELSDIHAALAYYYDHRNEIDRSILEDELLISELRMTMPSKVPEIICDK
ncbi:DUF433 domain-containing protein [candidate division KSB1 bacterium]|nr:DUF433 domain-containing protein [candidate division KSB1 bacterium]MBL7094429.1 DUF433 domain-containing protein [candidate division KSB1 bacterium]